MDKDVENPEYSPDEEYHFAEEPETPPPFVPTGSGSKQPKGSNPPKRRKWLILIGLVVIAFLVYKLLNILFTARGKLHLPTTATKVVSPPSSQTTSTTTQVEQLSPPPVAPPANSSQVAAVTGPINDRLQALEQKSTISEGVLDRLSNQITELQGSITSVNNRMNNLSDSMQVITTKITHPVPVVVPLAKVKKVKVLKVKKVCPISKPIYFVRAMVQGRAWLARGCGGGTLTVAIGDTIPGYGVVRVIDPYQGTLTTSAGAIIGYSPEDS